MACFSAVTKVVESLTSYRLSPDLIPGKSIWDFWWTEWLWYRLISNLNTSVFSCLYHSTNAAYSFSPTQYILILAIDSVVKKTQALHSGRVRQFSFVTDHFLT
jgi:hypothetical protein